MDMWLVLVWIHWIWVTNMCAPGLIPTLFLMPMGWVWNSVCISLYLAWILLSLYACITPNYEWNEGICEASYVSVMSLNIVLALCWHVISHVAPFHLPPNYVAYICCTHILPICAIALHLLRLYLYISTMKAYYQSYHPRPSYMLVA